MRVVLFSFDYAPLDGGIARLCTELVRGISEKGVDVSVLTAATPTTARDEPGVRRLPGSRLEREARALKALAELPASSVVLCGRWYPEGLLALLARRKSVVILTHGAELLASRVSSVAFVRESVRRRVLEAASLVVANSRYTGRLTQSVAPRARIATLPLGVNPLAFCPGSREAARQSLKLTTRYVVSTVARVMPFKGHDTVISALARLPTELRSEFSYLIAGRGSHADALRKLSQDLGVTQQVSFAGLVPEAQLVDVYRASNLFCLMTRPEARAVEGFGLALLEAQSCGVPVLGSDAGGIPDALEHGRTGFLLEPSDVAGVQQHLQALATDPELYRNLGIAGRNRAVASCTWQIYAENLLNELERVAVSVRAPHSNHGKPSVPHD
jgi:phosphatidyl-myo-inositol dimannoside synthase